MFPTPDEIEKTNVPQVGKVFSTLDAAKRFVNVYALTNGFGIKKGRNHKNRNISFVCNKSLWATGCQNLIFIFSSFVDE